MTRDLWPGEKPSAPAEAPTEVKRPPQTRADVLRAATKDLTRSERSAEFVTLGLLEVSAAIDRLTEFLRQQDDRGR